MCVHYTFADAHQRDYYVRVVEDAVAGSSLAAHDASLAAMEYLQTGARRRRRVVAAETSGRMARAVAGSAVPVRQDRTTVHPQATPRADPSRSSRVARRSEQPCPCPPPPGRGAGGAPCRRRPSRSLARRVRRWRRTAAGPAATVSAPTDKVLRLSFLQDPGQPPDPDIYYAGQGLLLTTNMYEGLLQYKSGTATPTIEPLLAEKWKVSKDNKTYDFVLRKGVIFHDGTRSTATPSRPRSTAGSR